jgi:glycosyltransferase involved in cell wall biosynthesis
VAPSGDRDGLPNVIPEAMSIGVGVVTSPAAATTEAITHGETGLVAEVDRPADWVAALRTLATDDTTATRQRLAARSWVEENFDAHRNAARLHAAFEEAIQA